MDTVRVFFPSGSGDSRSVVPRALASIGREQSVVSTLAANGVGGRPSSDGQVAWFSTACTGDARVDCAGRGSSGTSSSQSYSESFTANGGGALGLAGVSATAFCTESQSPKIGLVRRRCLRTVDSSCEGGELMWQCRGETGTRGGSGCRKKRRRVWGDGGRCPEELSEMSTREKCLPVNGRNAFRSWASASLQHRGKFHTHAPLMICSPCVVRRTRT